MMVVAFIVDVPQSITDPSTVSAQIFLWSDQPKVEKNCFNYYNFAWLFNNGHISSIFTL